MVAELYERWDKVIIRVVVRVELGNWLGLPVCGIGLELGSRGKKDSGNGGK